MRSSWRLRLAGIVLACPLAWLLADRTLNAGKPEDSRPAGTVRLVGGFGGGGEPALPQVPPAPTIHIVPRVTAKMAKTWEVLQRPIDLNFPQETPLEDFLKYLKEATRGKDDKGLSIYVDPIGLQEAEKTMMSPILIDLDQVKVATGLKLVLEQLGLVYYVQEDGLVSITSQGDEGPPYPDEKLYEDLNNLRQEVAALKLALLHERRTARPALPADEKKAEPAAPPAKKAQFRRTVQFGGIGAAPNSLDGITKPVEMFLLTKPLSAHAAETWRLLQTEVDVPFALETPLEDVLRFLKEKSKQGKDDKGFAIYVNPICLQETDNAITSAVQLELESIPIATALNLMLRQLGLKFSVHDEGFIVIDSAEPEETPQDAASLLDLVNAIRLDVNDMRREVGARDPRR